MENRAFRKIEWSGSKLLDCRILHQIPKGFLEPWAAPKSPAVSNEPPLKISAHGPALTVPSYSSLCSLLRNISTSRLWRCPCRCVRSHQFITDHLTAVLQTTLIISCLPSNYLTMRETLLPQSLLFSCHEILMFF